ncbi:hypothetical protein NP493_82g05008 [Ridgeia piscesae]|uniref:RZZ complex subunit KNTC1/ROD C-terminal domain-containing protein n=1 Tax=Ridgeia piscesae TaxID=27915 RepID=A0AAD9P9G7_RIDPI|nr:hypothetical protein NP493_82g05008 [Ridgeia piscesae]
MTTDHIRSVMCGLHYGVGLEELQMFQTLESFSRCNKVGLVKTILRSHSHKSRAVRLAAQLCLHYSIFEVPLWTNILKQLLTFQMVDFLYEVLVRLLPVSALWQDRSIGSIWKAALLAPMLSATRPVTGPQLDDCLRALLLLHRFPLIQDLDLAAFCKCFLQLDLPVCAAACAQLIPSPDTRTACLTKALTTTTFQQQLQQWTEQASTDPLLQQLLLLAQNLNSNTRGAVAVT